MRSRFGIPDVERLPLLAMIGFAARCARRATHANEGASNEKLFAALEISESIASGCISEGDVDTAYAAAAAAAASVIPPKTTKDIPPSSCAANSAANGARSFCDSLFRNYAVRSAAVAVFRSMEEGVALDDISKDFRKIFEAAVNEEWKDDTPIPRDFFPPIVTKDRCDNDVLFEIDPGTAPAELIAEFFGKLDAIYKIRGGSGIVIKPEGTAVVIAAPKVTA